MKKQFLGFAIILGLLLSSCSIVKNIDIEKRHYRSGFYVHLKKDKVCARDSFGEIPRLGFINSYNSGNQKFSDNFHAAPGTIDQRKNKILHKKINIKNSIQKTWKNSQTHSIKSVRSLNAPASHWLEKIGKILLVILISLIFPLVWMCMLVVDMVLDTNDKASLAGEILIVFAILMSIAWIAAIVLLILAIPLWLPFYLAILGVGVISFILMCLFYPSDVTV